MIARAKHIIAGLCIDQAAYDAGEAVGDAVLRICSSANRRRLARTEESDQILRLFLTILRREILDAHDRFASFKRGGAGVAGAGRAKKGHDTATGASPPPRRGYHRRHVELDRLPSPASPDAAEIIEDECFEVLLEHLDNPRLRTTATMCRQGLTVEEIAGRLQLTPRTIRHKIAIIRAVFLDLDPE